MVAGRSRRKFLGSAGAAALATCLTGEGRAGDARAAAVAPQGEGSQKAGALLPFGFVIHGGAGTIERSRMTPEREKAYRDKLSEALLAGFSVLQKGGGCLDAVVAAVTLLEDSPLFKIGRAHV